MVPYLVCATVATAAVRWFLHLGVTFSFETARAETRFLCYYDNKFTIIGQMPKSVVPDPFEPKSGIY